MKERDDNHEPVKKLLQSVMGQQPEISGSSVLLSDSASWGKRQIRLRCWEGNLGEYPNGIGNPVVLNLGSSGRTEGGIFWFEAWMIIDLNNLKHIYCKLTQFRQFRLLDVQSTPFVPRIWNDPHVSFCPKQAALSVATFGVSVSNLEEAGLKNIQTWTVQAVGGWKPNPSQVFLKVASGDHGNKKEQEETEPCCCNRTHLFDAVFFVFSASMALCLRAIPSPFWS